MPSVEKTAKRPHPADGDGARKRPAMAREPSAVTETERVADNSTSEDEADLDVEAKAAVYGWHFDMLHDIERNSKFAEAIARTLRIAHRERRPSNTDQSMRVLDIGTGSGLLAQLSLEAAQQSGIGCLVTAIEVDPTLAAIAHQNIASHLDCLRSSRVCKRQDCERNAVVLPVKSTSLRRSDLPFGGRPADLVVAEILDSGLIGEDCLPTMRHAAEELLHSEYHAVPSGAKVWAQLVEGRIFQHWDRINEFEMDVKMDVGLCGPGDAHPFDCHVGPLIRNGIVTPLTEPFFALNFNFCDPKSFPRAGRSCMCSATESGGAIHAVRNGTAHAVVFWWDCILAAGDGEEEPILLSNRPSHLQSNSTSNSGNEVERNHHWKQAVSVLTTNRGWEVAAGEEIKLYANHNDEDIWFAFGYGRRTVRRRPASNALSCKLAPPMPRAAASDLWHSTCDSRRLWQLNSTHCGIKLIQVVQSILTEVRNMMQSSAPGPLLCLDISEGSLMTLIAAQLPRAGVDAARDVFVSLERSKAAATLWRQVLKKAQTISQVEAQVYCVNGEIPPWLMRRLKRQQAQCKGDHEDDDPGSAEDEDDQEELEEETEEEQEEEEEEPEEDDDLQQNITSEASSNRRPLFHLVVAEPPYFDIAHHLWGEAALFFLWSQLSDLASGRLAKFHGPHKTLISPCLGRVMAMAIACPNLWKLQQPVTSESLGLHPGSSVKIDAINELAPATDDRCGVERPCTSIAMWKHEYQPMSRPFLMLEIDLTQPVGPLSSKVEAPVSQPSDSAGSTSREVHALLLWVDFVMLRANSDHEEIVWSTAAPMQQPQDGMKHDYERFANCFLQGVRFGAEPQRLHTGIGTIHASASLNPEEAGGHLVAGFTVAA